jgi:hypothetical protein
MSNITREITVDPSVIPPLDESLLNLSDVERDFLSKAITPDETKLKQIILEVQKECVSRISRA